MSNRAHRYHDHREKSAAKEREEWDKYLDPHWRRRVLSLVQKADADRARAHVHARAEARRSSLRLAGAQGGAVSGASPNAPRGARRWETSRRGTVAHYLEKARGELLLEYPWLDPDYLYYKYIRRA